VDRATLRYHLDLAETYLGMPMFSALCGVWGARAGDRQLAARFLEAGIFPHLVEPYLQFNETAAGLGGPYGNAATTVFLTNPAGFLMSLLLGLTGLQLDGGDPAQWGKFPIVMPAGRDGIEVERVWARGRPARLSARHGAPRATIEVLD